MTKSLKNYAKFKGKTLNILGFIAIVWIISSCSSSKPFSVSAQVSPNELTGTWYEIAHLGIYNNNCSCGLFSFSPGDSRMAINKTCYDRNKSENQTYSGFLEPLSGYRELNFNYKVKADLSFYVLDVSDDHRYILLGSKDRKRILILSRTTDLAAAVIKRFLNVAEELDFETSGLVFEKHNCG